MRVLVQVGYSKAAGRRRDGQKIQAFLNDMELQFEGGMYLTSRFDAAKGFCWYLCELDVIPKDVIRIECMTAVAGIGPDPKRTFSALYYASEDSPVREIEIRGVGKRNYPIIKGRILEIGSVSEEEKHESAAQAFMKDGF